MYYRPSEIATILEVNVDTVRRSYLAAGCPCERDEKGHIWIIGTAFRVWAEEILAERKRKKSEPMAENEVWCMKCNKRVELVNPKPKRINYHLELLQSKCPECGTKVNRARRARS
jgi:DNA-directed RNA polymerase subunit RPC12/RpoP